jgi:hypothetical protein
MSAPDDKELRSRDVAVRVNQFRSSRMVFQRNYEELLTFLDYICAPAVAFSYSPVDQKWLWHDGMNEIERLLHNFVAAALSLVDHTRVLYRQLYEPAGHLSQYQEKVDADFVEDPLTQFVIKLRQMAQHYRLPGLENHTQMTDIKNGLVGTVRIQMRLKVDDLRKFDGWNVPANKFLDSAGPHIDLRDLIVAYHAHVTAFYEWFDQRQKEMHGIGPDLFRHLSMHGVSVGPRKEIAELADGISKLENKQREEITFGDLETAFAPVLSILDTRRLMLCRYDGRVWIQAALAAAQSRFSIPSELEARIRALV